MCPGDQGLDDNEIFVSSSQWEDLSGERCSSKAMAVSGVPGLVSPAALALSQIHRGGSGEGCDT